jgi:tetratricopeptide (TPR) repeat protein
VTIAAAVSWTVLVCSASGATLSELLDQGDRLTQSDEGFPESFRRALSLYREAASLDPQNPAPYIGMARTYLALGDWSEEEKLPWYERGELAAERALALKEDSAEAHFLLAANRGNVANLWPFWKVSPTILADLERHLQRALTLDPRHARALHMMGIVLDRTPGPLRLLLEGRKGQAEDYLVRAAAADSRYAYIQWSLAEFYQEAGRLAQARAQAKAVLAMSGPIDRRLWMEKYRPAAEALVKNSAAP